MRIGILQPSYLPWLGFFEQLNKSDIFIIYDDVQYDKNGWRNRNKIKTPNGSQWLTVPVHIKFEEHPLIMNVKIDNKKNWRKTHLYSIRQNYSKAPFYKEYINIFEEAYLKDWDYLVDVNMYFISKLLECLGIKNKKMVKSSTINVEGGRIQKLVNICKVFKADIFYEGLKGMEYIDERSFNDNGIKVEYQNYKHPEYNQLYGDFISYLSVIDLLLNHGEDSLGILMKEVVK